MTFTVRQKVVCVDDAQRVRWKRAGLLYTFHRYQRLGHNLNRGFVYTITAITQVKDAEIDTVFQMLHLDEAWHFEHREIGFPSFQFRPAVETKTDISIFKKMLIPAKEDACTGS